MSLKPQSVLSQSLRPLFPGLLPQQVQCFPSPSLLAPSHVPGPQVLFPALLPRLFHPVSLCSPYVLIPPCWFSLIVPVSRIRPTLPFPFVQHALLVIPLSPTLCLLSL